ncbi:MAG TPA: peptidylprolyl isomerase [Croceibacterium sp.]|nr:peptidylprolyl isomerase [Croceibacterium sp.]
MQQLVARLRGSKRDPFIVFLAAAAVIFLLYWVILGRRETIEVPTAVQQSLYSDYALMTGHDPDDEAKTKLIDDYVANELLFREAVERGMHMTDLTTKQRLIDRVRFMISGAPAEPTEDTLMAWYAEHPRDYRAEPSLTLRHVFFEQKPADVDSLLRTLESGGTVQGNDFWMGRELDNYGHSVIRAMFGEEFLETLSKLPEGKWVGPLKSTRGWHLVLVTGKGDERLLSYPEARDEVRQDYLTAEAASIVAKEVARLKEDYAIRVE